MAHHWFKFLVLAPLIAVLVIAWDIFFFGFDKIFSEGHGIENASFALLAYAFLGFCLLAPDRAFGSSWHVSVILFLLAARELDLDKRLLDDGIYKSNLYRHDNPLLHKLIGGVIVAVTLWSIWRLIRRSGPGWFRALRRVEIWSIAVLVALISVIIAKTVDGADRKMQDLFDIGIPMEWSLSLVKLEEVLELLFGLLIVVAVAFWSRRSSDARVDWV